MFDLSWYYTLNHPFLTPPAWIFPPVWAFLYLTLLIALLIYGFKKSQYNKTWGYILFFTQLGLNICWSPVFFHFHNIGLGLAIIVLLVVLTFWNIVEFLRVSKTAGIILIPYFLWISFATYLNAGIFILN